MCGRFLLSSPPDAVGRQFGLAVTDNFPPRYNIAPTQPIGTIREEDGVRRFALSRWGFIPSWAKKDWHDRMGGKPLINARAETVLEKPTFRNAFKRRRCLVPADGFYEWRTEDGARQPYLIAPAAGGLIGFAAVWETAHDPDGGEIDTVAILTAAAGPDIFPLHNREPVTIAPADRARWLAAGEAEAAALLDLTRAQGQGFWTFRAVSREVNNVRNEGERLTRAVGQQEMF